MNTSFKRKALTCAVLAGLGVSSSAEAAILNQSNTGEVLIFPYYTTQANAGNAYNTYVSITNTTAVAKVLKVRFREGKTSAEVLDFNLYLSPNDMWVAAVVPDGQGTDNAARLIPAGDLSCTDPVIPSGGEPFKNFAYSSGADALPGTTLDRTREGYIEVFEMGVLSGTPANNVTHPIGLPTAAPTGCAAMRSADGTTAPASLVVGTTLLTPSGGLYGMGTLINVSNGADFGYVADAIDFYAQGTTGVAGGPYYFGVGSPSPTLGGTQVAPNSSLRIMNGVAFRNNYVASVTLGTAGARTVASLFMHTAVLNDYILDTGTLSNTDWVLTFPTKREMVNSVSAGAPFTNILSSTGACETALFTIFNRDEQSVIPPSVGFSPQAPGGAAGVGTLCWESTVLSFGNGVAHTPTSASTASAVLGSKNKTFVSIQNGTALPYQNGWASVTFTGSGATTFGLSTPSGTSLDQAGANPFAVGVTFFGLPVTGFMVRTLNNNAVSCTNAAGTAVTCQGNYSTLYRHAYRDRFN
jgi:hypothetical protein